MRYISEGIESVSVSKVTYSSPTKKTEEMPSLRLRGMCSFQITVCGRIRMAKSDTQLKTVKATLIPALSKQCPCVMVRSQAFEMGVQEKMSANSEAIQKATLNQIKA